MENLIHEKRVEKKMSQEELAEKAKLSRTTVSNLESGKTKFASTDTLTKIANALEEPVSSIFFVNNV